MVVARSRPLSIYVHFPYCSKICSFCAFNKYRLPRELNHGELSRSFRKELAYNLNQYKNVSSNRAIRSVYFGGGTPSLSPTLVSEVLDELYINGFVTASETEVTLEANPTSLPDIRYLQNLGVTRVSLGVQSLLDDDQLYRFNREHSGGDSRSALDRLVHDRALLSDGFSFDLMFGNPLKNIEKNKDMAVPLHDELALALPYAKIGGHLSLYELTVERGTPLSKQVTSGEVMMPEQDDNADEYELAVEKMSANGFDHYEISSFALPGHYGRHNLSFWMHEDLIGVGPGAHGRIRGEDGSRFRTRAIPDPKRWAQQISLLGHGQARIDSLRSTFTDECISLGLRTEYGISRTKFKESTGCELEHCLDMDRVSELEEQGLVIWEGESGSVKSALPDEWRDSYVHGGLRASERGRSLLDLITPMLIKSH